MRRCDGGVSGFGLVSRRFAATSADVRRAVSYAGVAVQVAPRIGGGLLVTVAWFWPRTDLSQHQQEQQNHLAHLW